MSKPGQYVLQIIGYGAPTYTNPKCRLSRVSP
jgi:hypothetical protein